MLPFLHRPRCTRFYRRSQDLSRVDDFGPPRPPHQIRRQTARTVVKLMMACNDLTITNQALGDWKQDARPGRKPRQTGACMYFIRAQIAHLHEGIKIIEEIRNDDT
jgi:hypothetical protein